MSKTRYNNCPCYEDGYYFPSLLERDVYVRLSSFDKQIHVHPKISLASARVHATGYIHPALGYISPEAWKDITWTPDFYSPRFNLYFEAKGVLTEGFKLKMQVAGLFGADILERLVIVARKKLKWQGIRIMDFPQFNRFLLERKNAR